MNITVKRYNTVVIGGGPAGLFTAANLRNKNTLLIEKGERPGRKLLISGTGQCNFTHNGPIGDFLNHYGDNAGFLEYALHSFSNTDLIRFFEQSGVASVEDKNGKLFPASLRASDILNTLLDACSKGGITILRGSPVTQVNYESGVFKVMTAKGNYQCRNLVIATGGMSYPSTGSTGDGYRFGELLGHSVIPPRPSLCAITVRNYRMAELSGIAIPSVFIGLYRKGLKIREHRGDIVFTHRGLSGPGIIDISRYISSGDFLRINFSGQGRQAFLNQFNLFAQENGRTALQTWLRSFSVPKNLLRFLLSEAEANPEQPMAEIRKQLRIKLSESLCECPFEVERTGGFNSAMATTGGICLDEVSPMTMQSAIINNLYFVGEVLDIDGDTGGYNIQAAFSTAHTAAMAINRADRMIEELPG